jgi:hypothetical protein
VFISYNKYKISVYESDQLMPYYSLKAQWIIEDHGARPGFCGLPLIHTYHSLKKIREMVKETFFLFL